MFAALPRLFLNGTQFQFCTLRMDRSAYPLGLNVLLPIILLCRCAEIFGVSAVEANGNRIFLVLIRMHYS